MDSDDIDLQNLREWQPNSDVFQRIPIKIQKGFFFQELNITCIDALPEYLALGSNVGIIFWYNRRNGNVQKLRTESTAAITCIRLVSSVEYMVAAGNAHGEVNIFQIQKELPTELASHELAASLITPKPIERYTIKDAYRGAITCIEWSKNGMKLFSGDCNGVVVMTELDFGQHISKSIEVINEKFGIIQIQFSSPWLLISTLYRAIVCKKDETNQWKLSQIGRTDRKVLNDFGSVFTPIDVDRRQPPSVICARPGFRFWLADIDGNVSQTFLLKESVNDIKSIFEVPLLNPVHNKSINIRDTHFGPCYYYMGKYIVTYCESMVFIVSLEKVRVIATIKRLRNIQYLTVNGNEIFIIEGGRSIVRISIVPEGSTLLGGTKYIPSNNDNLLNDSNIEIQEEMVSQADECFELPPIENICLDVPIECSIGEHNLLKEDKLLLEHSRKLEVFEKINTLEYDDSILFQNGTKKKKKTSVHSTSSDETKIDGVVEIGRHAEFLNRDKINGFAKNEHDTENSPSKIGLFTEFTTKPCLMQVSFCDGISNGQDVLSLNDSESDETYDEFNYAKQLKEISPQLKQEIVHNLKFQQNEPLIKNQKISPEKVTSHHFKPLEFGYPVYPGKVLESNSFGPRNGQIYNQITLESPLIEVPLTIHDDDDDDDDETDASFDAIKQCANNRTPINSPPKSIQPNIDRKNIIYPSNLVNLPKLWDIKIEKCDENQYNDETNSNESSTKEGSDNEWVFL